MVVYLKYIYFLLINVAFETVQACELYLAPSLVRGTGIGVFSGVDVSANVKLDTVSTVLFENLLMQELSLLKFAYGSDIPEYSACAMGSLMMMNHREIPNIQRGWSSAEPSVINSARTIFTHPYTTSRSFDLVSTTKISAGEEIFSNYGGRYWFDQRHVTYNPQVNTLNPKFKYKLHDLKTVGHCLSNIKVNQSGIPMAGRGVYAGRRFAKGELVSISPVMFMPKRQVMREETSSLLLNYCLASDDADLLALPFGTAGMCNHGGRHDSSLEMRWYQWPSSTSSSAFSGMFEGLTAERLLNASDAPLYLGYYATRSIAQGEELTVDYGTRWEEEWLAYLEVLERWMDANEDKLLAAGRVPASGEKDRLFARAPQFRTPVGAGHLMSRDVFSFTLGGDAAEKWGACTAATEGRPAACVEEDLQGEAAWRLDVEGVMRWRELDASIRGSGDGGGRRRGERTTDNDEL
jgi:hypothetical protein